MDITIRIRLLLSIQRALLGRIYPSMVAVTVQFMELKKLTVRVYLDREPVDFDYENMSEATSEVISDIAFLALEELCLFYKGDAVNQGEIPVYWRMETSDVPLIAH